MCGETKPQVEFAFSDIARGTRQRHCRTCQAAYRRAHYLANRDEYIRREVARIDKYRIENRALLLAYLLAHPCVDCGCANPVMLDFDHRDPATKRGNVSELAMRKPWRLVLVEIAKCDVRCANCHLRRTAIQFGWKKIEPRPLQPMPSVEREATRADPPLPGVASSDAIKTCTRCGVDKPATEFRIKNTRTGTRSSWCRSCQSAYGKLHYKQHKQAYLVRNRMHRHRSQGRSAYWYWLMTYLDSHPCVDCGQAELVVLQFDHRDGTEKVSTIGALLNHSSWERLVAEVAKCDVRCANCHRIKTAQQFHWSKSISESA
jgi:hypothetical protein